MQLPENGQQVINGQALQLTETHRWQTPNRPHNILCHQVSDGASTLAGNAHGQGTDQILQVQHSDHLVIAINNHTQGFSRKIQLSPDCVDIL
jgi:hypothetical protein